MKNGHKVDCLHCGNSEQRGGIMLGCNRCGNIWKYTGNNRFFATCSKCRGVVNVRKNVVKNVALFQAQQKQKLLLIADSSSQGPESAIVTIEPNGSESNNG